MLESHDVRAALEKPRGVVVSKFVERGLTRRIGVLLGREYHLEFETQETDETHETNNFGTRLSELERDLRTPSGKGREPGAFRHLAGWASAVARSFSSNMIRAPRQQDCYGNHHGIPLRWGQRGARAFGEQRAHGESADGAGRG